MVTVGCLTPDEAREDIEISLAALESRRPDLEGREQPQKDRHNEITAIECYQYWAFEVNTGFFMLI